MPASEQEKFRSTVERKTPELPEVVRHVWGWFSELNLGRREGFNGPGHITHQDILAWRELSGTVPSPSEVRLILLLDSHWRAEMDRLWKLKHPQPLS